MQEILFLLLPLAFYSGWNAARKRNKKQDSPNNPPPSAQFVRGINFLLNEEPDKALDIFLEAPTIDGQTAETFLSLGNMFRNRGEVNRALRVHQHLVARPDLDNQQRQSAMVALGEDFFAAGMLDRAESVFREIVNNYPGDNRAVEPLRHIYEQLQEWDKAIELGEQSASSQSSKNRFIAHYYCEQATAFLQQNKLYQADESLRSASRVHEGSARVAVLQAELALIRNEQDKALNYYCAAIEKDPRLLGMLSRRLLTTYTAPDELKRLYEFVKGQYAIGHDSRLFPVLLDFTQATGKSDGGGNDRDASDDETNVDLQALLLSHLENERVTIHTISRSLQTAEQQAFAPEIMLPALKKALERLANEESLFRCAQCGYKMQDYLWRCPACKQWDSVVSN